MTRGRIRIAAGDPAQVPLLKSILVELELELGWKRTL